MPEHKKQDTKTTTETPAETTTTQDVNLTVADLRNLRTIIDIHSVKHQGDRDRIIMSFDVPFDYVEQC